jgi:hypothetical protein
MLRGIDLLPQYRELLLDVTLQMQRNLTPIKRVEMREWKRERQTENSGVVAACVGRLLISVN